jgi:hypothetical protein
MFALLRDEDRPTFATELTAAELVIYEFNQWSNPRQPSASPTTMCWFEPERTAESAF